jgi:hypothetical protein
MRRNLRGVWDIWESEELAKDVEGWDKNGDVNQERMRLGKQDARRVAKRMRETGDHQWAAWL